MALSLSPIQIVEIQILHFNFDVLNSSENSSCPTNINIGFSNGELSETEPQNYRMEAQLDVASCSEETDDNKFSFSMTVRGMFNGHYIEGGDTFDEFETFMEVNAFSLLYGFVRNYLQNFTASTPIGQVVLPCVDSASIAVDLNQK